MIANLLEMTIYWAVFYLLYALLLSRTTFFALNRGFLLLAFIAGAILPWMNFQPLASGEPIAGIWLKAIEVGHLVVKPIEDIPAKSSEGLVWWHWLWIAGAAVALSRTLAGVWSMGRLIGRSVREARNGYVMVHTDDLHLPFSFFHFLFWSRKFQPEPGEKAQILRHEEVHIRQWHSLDVLLFELAGIVLWWHPLVYAYRTSVRQVHEYLADAAVLRTADSRQYGRLLLGPLQTGVQIAMANHFIRSQLKNRIIMMTRQHSSAQALGRYLLALPLAAFLVFSCNLEPTGETTREALPEGAGEIAGQLRDTIITFDPSTYEQTTEVVTSDIYMVVEEMPRFPGCEDEPAVERNTCAQQKMMTFLFGELRYPEKARDEKVEGTVVVQFVVDKAGNILNPKIVKGLGAGCDEEVLRVVSLMPQWVPGRQEGKPAAVQFNLPVKFKLG
jgi:TonB family protein